MPKLSVICTAYNTEKYVDESLKSILAQTFDDFEVILVDDGSTDETGNILKKYTKQNDKFKLFINPSNKGIPYSRNMAIANATGEYIAIHDSDDVSLPNRFAEEVELLDKHPDIAVVGSHAARMSHTGEDLGSMAYPRATTKESIYLIIHYHLNPIIDPTSMSRRQVIVKHGCYSNAANLKTVADFDLWCRLLSHGYEFKNIMKPLIKYRINPTGLTRQNQELMKRQSNDLCEKFKLKHLKDPQFDELFYKQQF